MKNRNRRRNFFIDRDFQSRFIMRFAAVTTIWSMAAALLFSHFIESRLQDALYSSHLALLSAGEMLVPTALYTHGIALLLFVLLLAYAIHSLWKKIAVPLFILQRDLTRIASGDLVNEVVLRKEDEFQTLAASVDEMRSGLHKKFVLIKARYASLSLAVAELDRASIQGHPLGDRLALIKDATAHLRKEFSSFER